MLVDTTARALRAGIAAAVPGNHVRDISGAIEDVATPGRFGIVRTFVGHGIGTEMHQDPQVPNYRSRDKGLKLRLASAWPSSRCSPWAPTMST